MMWEKEFITREDLQIYADSLESADPMTEEEWREVISNDNEMEQDPEKRLKEWEIDCIISKLEEDGFVKEEQEENILRPGGCPGQEGKNMEKTKEEIVKEFNEECEEIARMCEEEGYPAHGSNYELRVADLLDWYKEQYPEYF